MNRIICFLTLICVTLSVHAQSDTISQYIESRQMIPMRDGVKLFTVIVTPVNAKSPSPILLERTPYGADNPLPKDSAFPVALLNYAYTMAREGYIFVYQDIRGKSKSEGSMQIHMPIVHVRKKGTVDESTDTWDTIDWLIRNVKNNNGKAGIYGISYPGWLALVGAIDPHPALKAASEQACMSDLFLGDDFHHNGAFRLSYGFEYTYGVEMDKTTNSNFPFPQFDLYNWYLHMGTTGTMDAKYFHGKVPTWKTFIEHPNYDSYWQNNSPLSYMDRAEVPQLHVGGYYDQEDLNGPQLMYSHMEKKDSSHKNYIVLGPWYHGQWAGRKADSIGMIALGGPTAIDFQKLQKRWFDYWLKGIGDGRFDEATCFQTGSNQWKTYESWPPRQATEQKLYVHADNTASFMPSGPGKTFVSYVSDPAHPVPYRPLPIEMTYGTGSRWQTWQVGDQRFVYTRPDVVHFSMDSLTRDLTVTGKVVAHLMASTSGSDADWIVKIIDEYPAFDTGSLTMSGYQLPVAMEVFRGRYRKSFSKPTPLIPGKAEEFIIDLHDINHVFRKGHRIVVEIQSSWFPVIDRNPQKFVPSIYEAKDSDYIKAEQKIICSGGASTYISLPVVR